MPLLRLQDLPSFDRVAQDGARVCTEVPEQTKRLDIGLLNMMPDAALAATERQFLHLLDSHDRRCCAIHLFTIDGVPRGNEGAAHLAEHYRDCTAISDTDLDALVITGANVTQPDLGSEPFWESLAEVLRQADQRGLPAVCSCLAAHASAQIFHGITRKHLPQKRWGIYEHSICTPKHPLVAGIPALFEMPHSRFNDIPESELLSHGVQVLIRGKEAGVQMAVEADGRRVYFQGHPEYEAISLLKEYKREILGHLAGERDDYPPYPNHTFNEAAMELLEDFRARVQTHGRTAELRDIFPEESLAREMRAPWRKVSKRLFSNWLYSIAR